MSLLSRFFAIFGAKMNKALDRVENPAETLDYSYEKQLTLLKDVRRGLAEIATSKQRLRMQVEKLRQQESKLTGQAQQAVLQGNDQLARVALQRKEALTPQIDAMERQIQQLDTQQESLAERSQQLQAQIERFRAEKEALKARYAAGKAQVRISESFTGISSEMNNLGASMQRAQDRIEQMEARAGALDELVTTGALEDVTQQLSGEDDIDRQLRLAGGTGDNVDQQLAALKAQLGKGEQNQLPPG